MKTSNRLLLVGAFILGITATALAVYIKNGLVEGSPYERNITVITGDQNIVTKDIGTLKSDRLDLGSNDYILDPHSDRITMTASSNIIESYNAFNNDVFAPRLRWQGNEDGDVKKYRISEDENIHFNIGIKGMEDLKVLNSNKDGRLTFKDTLQLNSFSIILSSRQDSIEILVNAKSASISLENRNSNLKLSGSAGLLFLDVTKYCNIDGANLIVENASVRIGEDTSADLFVTQTILGARHGNSSLKVNGGANLSNVMKHYD